MSTHIIIYGAYGHTGRFVVRQAQARGLGVVAVGRSQEKLEALERDVPHITYRQADAADADALNRAFAGAALVINCAGPFADTAAPVAQAALAAGAHYLDVAAEQAAVHELMRRFDGPARAAGKIVAPALAFYGGLADLLATEAAREFDAPDLIEIGVALDSWAPTLGTRKTGARNAGPRLFLEGGALAPDRANGAREWRFPEPFGAMSVVNIAMAETVLIARHLPAQEARLYLSANALSDLNNPQTPPPAPADEKGRSAQSFLLDVRAHAQGRTRRIIASGRDIYAITAPIVAEAAARLLRGPALAGGAYSAGQLFEPLPFLNALGADWIDVAKPASGP